MQPESTQQAYFWLLDVRNVWEGTKIDDAAPDALSLLSAAEATKARGFHFLKDAKLSLASSLLKRLFAATAASPRVTWAEAQFGRKGSQRHGKPCLIPPSRQPVQHVENLDIPLNGETNHQEYAESDFNISHQAGLVALGGFADVRNDAIKSNPDVKPRSRLKSVGVDIVCVNERNDARSLDRHGFDGWVDMHSEVFSEADVLAMKAPIGDFSSETEAQAEEVLQRKMRRFYAYWALKEAYVKMEGEALLASWLRQVEFRNVKVPVAAMESASNLKNDKNLENGDAEPEWGETVRGIEVYLRGQKRGEVELFLQAFQGNYMIATAVVKEDPKNEVQLPHWRALDLDRDIYPFAV